jgi:hypothetical protein
MSEGAQWDPTSKTRGAYDRHHGRSHWNRARILHLFVESVENLRQRTTVTE